MIVAWSNKGEDVRELRRDDGVVLARCLKGLRVVAYVFNAKPAPDMRMVTSRPFDTWDEAQAWTVSQFLPANDAQATA